jgi:hypothetical protein
VIKSTIFSDIAKVTINITFSFDSLLIIFEE